MTEFFPRVNVGEMYFNDREFNRRDRIPQRHAGMRECPRIQNHHRKRSPRFLDPVHQLPLMIALPKFDPNL